MRFIVRLFWYFSAAGFLFSLFYAYGHIKQIVYVEIASQSLSFSRSEFFFFFLSFFIVTGLLLSILGRMIPQISDKHFFVPQRMFWTESIGNRKAADAILIHWIWVIGAAANYFFIFWMLYIESQFNFEGSKISNIGFFQWPGLLMAISLFFPFFRLFIKNVNLLGQTDRA